MGRYRLGDIVRMTRKSLGITQEQLCNDICSAETLSRIENGCQTPTRDTYELLMERMGRIRSRAYSMLSVSDLKVLEKMKLFEDYIKLYDFNQADNILREIEEIIGDSTLDKQFLTRAESLVNYYLNRIDTEEFLQELQKAIKMTIPKYGIISLANWPLNFHEVLLLINISIAYAEKGNCLDAISAIEEAYTVINKSYMEEEQRVILKIAIANNLSKWYGLTGYYEKAIDIAQETVLLCKKYKLGNALPNLLYGIAWNKERLIEMGVLSLDAREECFMYLKQAYYISTAIQSPYAIEFLHQHILTNYNDFPTII